MGGPLGIISRLFSLIHCTMQGRMMSKHIEPWTRRCFLSVNLLGLTPTTWQGQKRYASTVANPDSGRQERHPRAPVTSCICNKLQETQQHLEEVRSLMQQQVPLEGLISDQDRTLQAAKSCLKRHVRVEALANVMERTVTTQQLQFMHEMAQTNCQKSNDTEHIRGEPDNAAHITSCQVADDFFA